MCHRKPHLRKHIYYASVFLGNKIAAAEEIDLSKYVEAGQAEFTTALEAAQSVYKDGDAMQAEINEVADKLLNAMLNAFLMTSGFN